MDLDRKYDEDDIESFLAEKERIRRLVGQVGAKPTTAKKITTVLMLTFIIATLIAAPFLPKEWELPAVEVGLALISLKIFFMLQNELRVSHFQFWMLSSLEWRMNDMSKRLIRIEKALKKEKEDD
ncbi:hypothetical protein HQ585_16330 [candidate division KSB1 bacterium]|nr:hypothetical protein [candidate division KSB1 bacterium]